MHKQNPEDYEIANQLRLTENKPPAKATKRKKHGAAALRKAPQAPKRFKSSYIMFFTAKRDEVKAELGGTPTVCSGKHVLVFTYLFGGSYLCSCSRRWRKSQDERPKSGEIYLRKNVLTGIE